MAELIKVVDGQEVISMETFALLLGQDPTAVRAEYDMQQAISPGSGFKVPPEWLQAGRRQARQVAAEIGSYDFLGQIQHLTTKGNDHEGL